MARFVPAQFRPGTVGRGALPALFLVLGLAASARPASAQWSVDRWVIAGGGGLSDSGNALTLAGTIGQCDAGITAGGPWLLSGGFWSAQTPDPASTPMPAPIPIRFAFYPCSPNPVRDHTRIAFDLPKAVPVRIEIYSVAGSRLGTVYDRPANAGHLVVDWKASAGDGRRLASGVYLVVAQAGGNRVTQHVVVLN